MSFGCSQVGNMRSSFNIARSFFASKNSFTKYDYFYIFAVLNYFNARLVHPTRYRNFPIYTVDPSQEFSANEKVFCKTYDYFLNNSDFYF